MDLPEPNGEKKIFQEKVFIPVQQHPEVSLNLKIMLTNITIIIQIRYFFLLSFLNK